MSQPEADPSPIRNVSDTALWVAIYRAMESERPDRIFHDPYARKLGGERGEAIVRSMPKGAATAWPMVVRTAVMDEIVVRCVREGAATVLNLAAGLDARPWRLDLPKSLRWFHVDMPDMIRYFRERMADAAPRCEVEFVSADLREPSARRELFGRTAAQGPVLVITEGLLVYLTPEQVGELARDLHDVARARWWLQDIASPRLRKFMERSRWLSKLQQGNAPMQFFPEHGTAFFEPFGWREKEFRSTWDESFRLKRTMRGAWFFKLLSKLQPRAQVEAGRRMSGIVLLESD
ncbi:MAG TPA: SAM-dependent methyltransferase [Rhodanobacteraceae bacterium]|nr:SAM-dependent methyltransferase [Rhodanobacteraceae bacterium]